MGGRLEIFQRKVRGRLRNWREEEHRADRLLGQLTSQDTEETKARGRNYE